VKKPYSALALQNSRSVAAPTFGELRQVMSAGKRTPGLWCRDFKSAAVAAALLMASTAAHAGNPNSISLEINGHKIRIESPKHCDALSCIKITGVSGLNLNGLKSSHDDDADTDSATTARATPTAQSTVSQPAAPGATTSTPASQPSLASAAPADQSRQPTPAAPAPVPGPTAAAQLPAATPASTANTPIGTWATEDDKGNVRIEHCGANLCGYAEKSGEKVLINMRPEDNKWVGRIHDPDGGGNYDSTIAMRGSNALRVQGCAFGGLFCGSQTWRRVS
jgi:uncharacterized protein (DUF2147 family)